MELAVYSNKYREQTISERISEIIEKVKRTEDLHRRNGEATQIILGGIAIAHKENLTVARSFLNSHNVPEATINRVLSGQHRKTDI